MCGICGELRFDRARVDHAKIGAMTATLIHRGPDDEGIYENGCIALGQRRLAIIDLNRSGTAPLANEDNTIWVAFNGEIYNFQELRADLRRRGHRFRTQTDTEVIVHLYEEYGVGCLAHMRGMFAFVVWDSKKLRLFAARDRLGKKPFFYTRTAKSLLFGSEIKALTAHPSVRVAPNFAAIDAYLTYQYVPSPLTAFENINKLPPAHYLLCEGDGTLRIERYWSPPTAKKTTAPAEEIVEEIRERLRDAVRLRLTSDAPLGAFLSGGVDSATVVALMAQETDKPVKTFSIGFDEATYNELPYARLVAQRYGTEHHEYIVRPELEEILPLLAWHYNEPFADSSAVPTYYLSKLAREHIKVALTGDGGDESFSGYDNYARVAAWSLSDAVPWPLRRTIAPPLAQFCDRFSSYGLAAKASRALTMFGSRLPERFRLQSTILKPQEKNACYSQQFHELLQQSEIASPLSLPWDEAMDSLDWMMRHDQSYYLPDCLMVKTDIASMANGLEVRCPLLDHELVEFAATIPSNLKRDSTGGKLILKRAVADLLAPEILNKPKTGFGLPVSSWFRREAASYVADTLLGERAQRRGLFNRAAIARMLDDQIAGRRDWSSRIWAFLFLEVWFREMID